MSAPEGPIPPGTQIPDFTLQREDGSEFRRADLEGKTTILVFYPFAFSPVCTDQIGLYEEVLGDYLAKRGVTMYGVSCDARWSQTAFREKLGVSIEQLSDFEPKGEACRAFGVYHPGGFPQRALVIVGPDAVVGWSYQAPSIRAISRGQPDFRRAGRGRRGLVRSRLSDLRSAPLPGLSEDDHVRGPADDAPVFLYADFECPYCAAEAQKLAEMPLRVAFRHFPVRTSHPRAWPAACAAEAAGLQGRFWDMHDLLFADQGRLEDPHLWERARTLGLDLERFEADRRSEAVQARVRRDFEAGVRGGIVTTPTLIAGETRHAGRIDAQLLEELSSGRR